MHWVNETLVTPLVAGIGTDRFKNALYVVDVYRTPEVNKCMRHAQNKLSHLSARQALHLVTELPLEVIYHDTIVAPTIPRPLVRARKLLRHPLKLGLTLRRELLELGLDKYPVEIFVNSVEKEDEELLRVVLP